MLKPAPLKTRARSRPLAQPNTSNALIASLTAELSGALIREPSAEELVLVARAIDRLSVDEIVRVLMGGDHFDMAEAWADRFVQAIGNNYLVAANEELARLGTGMSFELYKKHAIEKAAKGGSRRRPQTPDYPPPKTPNRFPGVPHEDTFIRRQAGKLITRINGEQRAAIREQLIARYNRERRPETLVRDLRRSIGLDAPRARALRNFENGLRESGAKNIETKVERYRQQLIRNRAETIARTESVAIENQGRIQAWTAAIDAGDLPVDAEQEWVTQGEPCELCEKMDGQRVPVGEAFTSPDYGLVEQPPLHPRCYCMLVVRAFTK